MSVRIVGREKCPPEIGALLEGRFRAADEHPEIEIVVAGGKARFSGQADCNLLIVPRGVPARRLLRLAHLVVSAESLSGVPADRQFRINEFDRALDLIV